MWKIEDLEELYALPLLELISRAHHVHAQFHPTRKIQVCSLISIKTGGCPEDCKYCAQSSRYKTSVVAQPMMSYDAVLNQAKLAIARGATRICLGAAWREVRETSKHFEEVIGMIKGIAALGVEVCCTLGMLSENAAKRLKEAGLYAYNHNLDTSETFYKTIITTRSYNERLKTLDAVERAGLSLCSGGILGLGETSQDRLQLLLTLCNRSIPPDSLPINRLAAIAGTPLENQPTISSWETIRVIAVARIIMPKTMIRIACGRELMNFEEQALCMLAGANSIFLGEKLLTVANVSLDKDKEMFKLLGINEYTP